MKPFLALLVLLLSASGPTFAQPAADPASLDVTRSQTQEAFDKLKTLAGTWVGQLTTTPTEPSMVGKLAQHTLQVTSRGNAILHELSVSSLPDHPVTMFYLEDDRLVATHYCDAGNRPRMVGRVSPDGKRVEFEFLDLSGDDQYGHMHGVAFTFIDENHHIEEWTWMLPDHKTVQVRFDLQRTTMENALSGT